MLVGLSAIMCQRHWWSSAPERGASSIETAAWDTALARARQVDVNTADAAELERLPGIGPALAARILSYRMQHGRFHHPEELRSVSGMGPQTFAAIKELVVMQ
ncbi:MAG: helix-hairpin-helix domain-containing protein [Candidatus Omnitrophica bacterium]|nr:helix-hairpin-helix domain-containing protein [Candidatus Omnitrophota bacterium]